MNILIDLRALQQGKTSGVEVFVEQFTRALCQNDSDSTFFLWTNSKTPLLKTFPKFDFSNTRRVHTNIPNRLLTFSTSLFRFPAINDLVETECMKNSILSWDQHFSVALFPDPRPAPIIENCKKICVIHDLTPIHFPKFFRWKTRFFHKLLRLKKEIKESSHVFTPSEFTKTDLAKTLKVSQEKITTIGCGSASKIKRIDYETASSLVREKYSLPQNFFLFLGTLEKRKNLHFLLHAFDIFRARNGKESWNLVIAGETNADIFPHHELPEIAGVHFIGFVEEKDKSALYSLAKVFVFPSLFEGFGIPVLEAMQAGCPIIASKFSSLPEVYAKAGIGIDPTSVESLVRAMNKLFHNPELLEEFSQKALTRSKEEEFYWDTVAKKALSAIQEICEE
jgi:glycosyltransferase involved in cell wall biosynthesis